MYIKGFWITFCHLLKKIPYLTNLINDYVDALYLIASKYTDRQMAALPESGSAGSFFLSPHARSGWGIESGNILMQSVGFFCKAAFY